MPKHSQTFTIDITPERFVELCSLYELEELSLALSRRFARMAREEEMKTNKNTSEETDFDQSRKGASLYMTNEELKQLE